jgi:MFS family permease
MRSKDPPTSDEERLDARSRPPFVSGVADDTLVEPGRTSTIAALASRNFRLFWVGLLVSSIGMWMQMFGQGYLVVQLAVRDGVPHFAPLYLGLVGLSRAIPGLTFGLFGGVVADRADRRQLLLTTQIAASVIAGTLAILTITERINIVEVLLLGALNSMVHSFEAPTRQSMVPALVPRRHLSSAVGLSSAAFNGAQFIGPLLGGLLYIPLGVGGLFAVNAVSYLAIVAALLRMDLPPVTRAQSESVMRSIREGLHYIRRDPVVRWVVILTAGSATLARPYPQLLPAITQQVLNVGAVELSWLMAASGAGALAGALATASLGNLKRRGLVVIASAGALGLLLAAFAIQRTLLGALPILILVGFSAMLFMGMANTLLQLRTPDHLRGRVMSVQTMMMMGVVPLGVMAMGSVGTFLGVDVSMFAGGVLLVVLASYAGIRSVALRRATGRPGSQRPGDYELAKIGG